MSLAFSQLLSLQCPNWDGKRKRRSCFNSAQTKLSVAFFNAKSQLPDNSFIYSREDKYKELAQPSSNL